MVELVSNEYVYVIIDDDINVPAAMDIAKRVSAYLEELIQKNKRGLILCEIRGSNTVDQKTRQTISELMQNMKYDKIAAYGAKTLMRSIANLTLMASGRYSRTRIFDTQEQALTWLRV